LRSFFPWTCCIVLTSKQILIMELWPHVYCRWLLLHRVFGAFQLRRHLSFYIGPWTASFNHIKSCLVYSSSSWIIVCLLSNFSHQSFDNSILSDGFL
jgi:hypothetical protein